MKQPENEEILWGAKNEQLLLTTHRLREMHRNIFRSTTKSIVLEELTSCELQAKRQSLYL